MIENTLEGMYVSFLSLDFNKGALVLKHESEFLYVELKNELHEHGMYSSLYPYQY